MAVPGTAAYGMYSRGAALPEIVYSLNREGFSKEDICLVLSPQHPAATAVRDAKLPTAKNKGNSSSVRTIGWFSEFGAVVIPTVGFFIRSQDYFRALLLEQDFPSLSRDCKTLAGLGFSEKDARRLGHELSDLGVLVFVACGGTDRADCARELLQRSGASEAASIDRVKASRSAAEPDRDRCGNHFSSSPNPVA